MLRLVFELEKVEGLELDYSPSPSDPDSELLHALSDWWARTVAEPYTNLNTRPGSIVVDWTFLDKKTPIRIDFDANLLEQLLETYTVFGWAALDEVSRILMAFPKATFPTKEFFRSTQNVVAVMIAHGLVEIEKKAVDFARKEWGTASERLTGYLKDFESVVARPRSFRPPHLISPRAPISIDPEVRQWRLVDRKLAKDLFELCHDYAKEAATALRLQQEIDVRNRKDPPETRQKGSGGELWFEIFAAPQRDVLNRMADLLKCIVGKLPAAVLVLGTLPDSVLSARTDDDQLRASHEVENLIHSTVQDLLTDLKTLETGLKMPGATEPLAEFLRPFTGSPRDFSSLRSMRTPVGGFERMVLEKAEQRLFDNLGLLSSLYDDPDYVAPGTWGQIVLYRYLDRLAEEVEKKRASDEKWKTFWAWLGRLTALLALIALMAVFPFGEAAVAPALAAILTISGLSSAILGMVTLLHDLWSGFEQAGQLRAEARDKVFRLVQTDPEAISEIGELLSRSRALRDGVSKGLLFTILTLGAAHKLRAVTVALNCQGFVSDVETLFEPAESAPSTGAEEPAADVGSDG